MFQLHEQNQRTKRGFALKPVMKRSWFVNPVSPSANLGSVPGSRPAHDSSLALLQILNEQTETEEGWISSIQMTSTAYGDVRKEAVRRSHFAVQRPGCEKTDKSSNDEPLLISEDSSWHQSANSKHQSDVERVIQWANECLLSRTTNEFHTRAELSTWNRFSDAAC